jgi:acetate kinase
MLILVLNCGSSSLKFQLIESDAASGFQGKDRRLARGLIDRIGEQARCTFTWRGKPPDRESITVRTHEEAMKRVFSWLDARDKSWMEQIAGAGHRVVHGGDRFSTSALIDDGVITAIEALNDLAPLHNPACLSGIRAARAVLGSSLPMVAVFDTAFHRTMPEHASTYAIPYELTARHRIRRYGFHGLAHHYLTMRYGEITGTPVHEVRIITLHLGNGCSASAVRKGESVDTSMGFTPLEGLVMGTRSGDLDPAVVGYLALREGLSPAEVETLLNKESGLLGLSGRSNDMREIVEQARDDARARLAMEIFCYRARKYVGAYLAALGGAQAVVFSGGIGENSPLVRAKICEGMEWCGLQVDEGRNAAVTGEEGCISADDAGIHAYVIPTDEELVIARETARVIEKENGTEDERRML